VEARAEQSLRSADALKGSYDVQRERDEPIVIDVGQNASGSTARADAVSRAGPPAARCADVRHEVRELHVGRPDVGGDDHRSWKPGEEEDWVDEEATSHRGEDD